MSTKRGSELAVLGLLGGLTVVALLLLAGPPARAEVVTCVEVELDPDPLELDVSPGRSGSDTLTVIITNCALVPVSETVEVTVMVGGLSVTPDIATVTVGPGEVINHPVNIHALPRTGAQTVIGEVIANVTQVGGLPNLLDPEEERAGFQVVVLPFHHVQLSVNNTYFKAEVEETIRVEVEVLNNGNDDEDLIKLVLDNPPEGWSSKSSDPVSLGPGNSSYMWVEILPGSAGSTNITLRPSNGIDELGPGLHLTFNVEAKGSFLTPIETETLAEFPVAGSLGLVALLLIAVTLVVRRRRRNRKAENEW